MLPGHGNRSHEELNELLGLEPDINDTSEIVNSPDSANAISLGLKPLAYANLKESGLSDEYIKLMRIQQAKDTEDYVIPYFDFDGHMRRDFYRTRLIRPNANNTNNGTNGKRPPKYLQRKDTPNHIWLPPNLPKLLTSKPYLIITEGEKKAASVAQHGIPAVALGGVDSWRTRKYFLDLKAISRTDDPDKVLIDLEKANLDVMEEKIAEELVPLAYFLQQHNKTVYITFDTDNKDGLREEVQTAAFNLALWLENRGLENVKLAVLLPAANGKMGLDDFVVKYGPDKIEEFLELPHHCFPTHPKPKHWIKSILGTAKVNRTTINNIARAVVASLDEWGNRFVDEAGRFYYFDSRTKILHTFSLGSQDLRNFRLDSFGTLLNSEFGIGTSDSGILSRIADAFVTVPGLHYTTPRRVVYTTEDTLYYQLSDSRVAKVTADKIEVVDNGTDGMLFLLGQVNPIVHKLVHKKTDKPRWIEILEQTSIQAMEGMSLEETHILLACMFYLNPWFKRWRGLMLPIEFAVAEPNSGKSFMYNLRLAILTGRPTLQHGPSTVRDWHADLTSTPAMWVGDNLGHLPNAMRNAMSDELARLVTDPSPSISMRKLYTTAENARLPVDCSFAMTAINNPFTREDLMQRSIIISLKAVPAGARDGRWYNREIEDGGREAWLADHLVIAQKFLKEVSRGWDNDYLSNHRLVNFEQSLLVMSRVLGYGEEMPAIIGKLTHVVQENIAQFNPVIESLRAFVSHRVEVGLEKELFFASEMIDWAISSLDFAHVKVLQDARQLGKYMAGHAYDIEQSTGISRIEGRRDGKARYQIDMTKAEKFLDAS